MSRGRWAIRSGAGLAALALTALLPPCSWGMSLTDALVRTYQTNPTILAARAQLRATDEGVAQAKQNWFRPTVYGQGDYTYSKVRQDTVVETRRGSQTEPYRDEYTEQDWSVNAQLPLYMGGTTLAGIDAAEADVSSGVSTLAATVQGTLAGAATAFVDVVMGGKLVDISRKQEESYVPLIKMSEQMYKDQTGTITDLAQVQTEIASARATVEQYVAALRGYQASFEDVVGVPPGDLEDWPEIPIPTRSLEESLRVALEENPQIRAAQASIEAAGFEVRAAKGTLLPQVYATASWYQSWDRQRIFDGVLSRQSDMETQFTAQLMLTWTFFDGGYTYSLVREQRQLLQEARQSWKQTIRDTREAVRTAWAARESARRQIDDYEKGIKAARIAVKGKQREFRDGSTSMTEVILAQQTLFTVVEQLATARGTYLSSGVTLLQAMGRFDEKSLGLPVEPYDPDRYLESVEDRWVGWGIE